MNKKTIILISIGYILSIAVTATITYLITANHYLKENNITLNNKVENKSEIKANESKENVNIENSNKDNNKNDNQSSASEKKNESPAIKEEIKTTKPIEKPKKDEINNEVKSENKENTNQDSNTKKDFTDSDIVKYVENISIEGASSKLKSGFVTVVDFLFYDGEIYGKTFKELSNSAKINVIALALKIDSKIDEYFPEYKEKISETTSKTYTSIKTKLVTLYLDTTVKICSENEVLCEDAKTGLAELKQNFGLTWEFIKDISGVGITKLKDWYQVWKEE